MPGKFTIAPELERALEVRPYVRRPGEPVRRPLSIFTRDPSISRLDGAVAQVKVPYEPLAVGPAGALLRVEDTDDSAGVTYEPVDLEDPHILLDHGLAPVTGDPRFAQQMVYAVCSRVYERFRRALGRDPSWGFTRQGVNGCRHPDHGRLIIRPHAFRDENAYYDPLAGELAFGYYEARAAAAGRNQRSGHVFTSLSHDIIVHEMSHALLDGMRDLFKVDSHPDVPAFHEGFADLVAIFQHFSYRETVEQAIGRGGGRLDDHMLVALASQFGQTMEDGCEQPLRSAIPKGENPETPAGELRVYDPAKLDSHALGSVLVAAVFEAYRVVYRRKSRDLLRIAGLSGHDRHAAGAPLPEALVHRLARVACALAKQFLNIVIRAIDYCPPVDLTFGEYLRAMITADADLVPRDPWAYREALVDAFRRRQVEVPGVSDLTEQELLWRAPERRLEPLSDLAFGNRRFATSPGRAASVAALRAQARALGRYVCQDEHRWYFGLIEEGHKVLDGDVVERPSVLSLRSVQRVSPGRNVAFDVVAEVIQRRIHRVTGATLYGGATFIIGPDGEIRYSIVKNVGSRRRMAQLLDYRDGRTVLGRDEFFRGLHRHDDQD